jgi:hypothetical protein
MSWMSSARNRTSRPIWRYGMVRADTRRRTVVVDTPRAEATSANVSSEARAVFVITVLWG